MELVVAAIVVGLGVTAWQVRRAEARRRAARWEATVAAFAARHGLDVDGGGAGGTLDGRPFRLERGGGDGARLRMSLGARGFALRPRRGGDDRGLGTGDAALDARWRADGDPLVATARLPAEVRALLRGDAALSADGELAVGSADGHDELFATDLARLRALASAWSAPLDPAVAAVAIARDDPNPDVRDLARERLLAVPPRDDPGFAALVDALPWTDGQRVSWAVRRGEAGRPTLRALAEHRDPSVARAAALALAALPEPARETSLPRWLLRHAEGGEAVLEALGRLAGPDAIPVLRGVAERYPDGRAAAARAAIDRIRARSPAGPGALSEAGADGRLSVPPDAPGGLSEP